MGKEVSEQSLPWSSNIPNLQNEYIQQFKALDGDTKGRLSAQNYLNESTAVYHGEVIGMGYLPKLYDAPALQAFESIVRQTYDILDKMTERFIEDADYRSLFRLSPLLEQMILLPSGYKNTIPLCRIDIFLDENTGGFSFCEFNTDGSSAMNEDREIINSLANTPTLKRFMTHHKVCAQELFDPWVECFLDIYGQFESSVPAPVVAIVDYMESAVIEEQLEFRNRFAHYGINCIVCEVASLEFRDGALYGYDISETHPAHQIPLRIDAIYRRAVTSEIVRELEASPEEAWQILSGKTNTECPEAASGETGTTVPPRIMLRGALALLAGVAQGNVCLIGSFRTQVAHSKASFCMLHHAETLAFLSTEEQQFIKEHVPLTTWLKADCIDLEQVKATKDTWIIKPVDGYGSKGVHAGKSFVTDEWHQLIDEMVLEDYIIQEYCPQFQTLNTLPIPYDETGKLLFNHADDAERYSKQGLYAPDNLEPYNILTGLFCYGGSFSGVYVRGGRDALIVGFRGGVALGTVLVDVPTRCLPRLRPIRTEQPC